MFPDAALATRPQGVKPPKIATPQTPGSSAVRRAMSAMNSTPVPVVRDKPIQPPTLYL